MKTGHDVWGIKTASFPVLTSYMLVFVVDSIYK